jgi:hypothetical protein
MSERSDIDRLLRHWMDDGPSTMPDRIVDVVADRIGVQSQRRSWRLLRRLPMNPLIKLGAAAAAVLVIAVIGYNLLPGPIGPGGDPSPTATPTAQPTATLETVRDLPEGPLAAGRYRLRPFDEAPSLSAVANIPSGWSAFEGWAVIGPGTNELLNGVTIAFIGAEGLFSDPCRWDLGGTGTEGQPGDVVVGPTAIDLVNALRASTAYTSTAPSPVSFGAFQGFELEIQMPSDIDFETCDPAAGDEGGSYWVFGGELARMYAHGAGERWHLYIVDVGGTRVIVVRLDYEGTPAAPREAASSIIESLEFTP